MRIDPFNFKKFNIDMKLGSHKGLHNHETYKGSIAGSEVKWYAKRVRSHTAATQEQLANELFRLIKPDNQPRTLIAKDQQNDKTNFYVLSEHLSSSSFHFMPLRQKHLDPDIKGLGEIFITSIWLNEVDLKHANLIKDTRSNQIGKIDGGACFYSLQFQCSGKNDKTLNEHVSFEPTLECINKLPHPQGYSTYNWLHYVEENKDYSPYQTGDGLNETRSQTLVQDINRALLRIILTPKAFLRAMVEAYLDANEKEFLDFLAERRTQLKAVALSSASFQNYLHSDDAQKTATEYVKHMSNFTLPHVDRLAESTLVKNSGMLERSGKSPYPQELVRGLRNNSFIQELQASDDIHVMKNVHDYLELQQILNELNLTVVVEESPISVNNLLSPSPVRTTTPGLLFSGQRFLSLWRGCTTNADSAIISPPPTPTPNHLMMGEK